MSTMDEPIPGILEQIQSTRRTAGKSALLESTTETIRALEESGLIEQRHRALVALVMDLADSIDATRNVPNPRASAIAMLVREYRETLDAMPVPEEMDNDAFERFMAALGTADDREGIAP